MKFLKWIYGSVLFVCFGFLQAQETYKLSPKSTLTVDGTSTVHDWTVTANTIEGELIWDGKEPKSIDFQAVVADMKSERGATMDTKMHNALKKDEHPKIRFVLKEVKNGSLLSGILSMAGNTQNVDIESKLDMATGIAKISGQKKIVLKDFDIEPPTAMFGQVVVGDEVTVKFNLVFEGNK